MFVGALKLDVRVLESRSLKDKRMVLRRVKDRVRERLGLAVVEVGAQELWQRAELGVACVSGDRSRLLAMLDDVRRCILSTEGLALLRQWRELSSFAGEAVELSSDLLETDAAPDGDPGDEAWVPAQWQRVLADEAAREPTHGDEVETHELVGSPAHGVTP